MKDKKIVGMIVVVLLVAGLSFLGGMKYGSSKNSARQLASRQGAFSQNGFGGQNGGVRGQGMVRGGGAVSGEVLAMDATSMTVKLGNGGSKIVLFSPTTKIEKTIGGAVTDVVVGKQVMITGTANPDGSVSATSVQIRPTLPVQTKTN